MGLSSAHTLLAVTNSFCLEGFFVRCDVSLVVEMFLLRYINVCGILLGIRLESPMAFTDGGQVENRTSWDSCVGLRSVVNRIVLSLKIFATPWASYAILCKLDFVELA